MKLTPEQVNHINHEADVVNRIIASNPQKGLFNYVARREALRLIIELHNFQLKVEEEARAKKK